MSEQKLAYLKETFRSLTCLKWKRRGRHFCTPFNGAFKRRLFIALIFLTCAFQFYPLQMPLSVNKLLIFDTGWKDRSFWVLRKRRNQRILLKCVFLPLSFSLSFFLFWILSGGSRRWKWFSFLFSCEEKKNSESRLGWIKEAAPTCREAEFPLSRFLEKERKNRWKI